MENIIISCLETKGSFLQEHLLRDCDFVGKIIQAEKHVTLEAGTNKVYDFFALPMNEFILLFLVRVSTHFNILF